MARQHDNSRPSSLGKEAACYVQEVQEPHENGEAKRNKLVLCFDGTSNQFKGNVSDTNVVKVYQMLDRSDKHQYHYYQPGIGTYRANSALQNTPSSGIFARTYSWIRAKADEAFANSFADHVMAGYKFLMRYYMEGDKIYVFGFSRGAYTARFLCELINEIGLLSKGNEEMVPFIWYQYIDYRVNPDDTARKAKIEQMRQTFCRPTIKVFWLGLWDCVSSVDALSGPGTALHAPRVDESDPNIALHVRHAVSCHERRVKFRPTLFMAAPNTSGSLQEMWFAGNHGDVGGGWDAHNGILLSDIPLLWMVEELMHVEQQEQLRLSWRTSAQAKAVWRTTTSAETVNTFDARREQLTEDMQRLQRGDVREPYKLWHDLLVHDRAKSGFSSLIMTPLWWLMECLPLKHTILTVQRGQEWTRVPVQHDSRDEIVMRKEVSHEFKTTRKPNLGRHRNIPLTASFHPSMKKLHDAGVIEGMAKWKFGPVGYNALVREETMPNGVPAPSLGHDHYMFVC